MIAVKIQLSSPRGVFRFDCWPGMLSASAGSRPASVRRGECRQNHRRAIFMGLVRHEVKTSACGGRGARMRADTGP